MKGTLLNLIPIKYNRDGLAARWVALKMLEAILYDKIMLIDLKVAKNFPFSQLSPEQKARSLSLLENVLRNLSQIDLTVQRYVKKPPKPKVLNILRLAISELILDKLPDYAAVNTSVELAKLDNRTKNQSGLINAVCRKVSLNPSFSSPENHLHLLDPFMTKLRSTYGEEIASKIAKSHQAIPPLDLNFKDTQTLDQLSDLIKGRVLPLGTLRLDNKTNLSKLPGYDEGLWWVQDFASSLPIKLLSSLRNKKVLDVCAAPGGKTMQLCAAGAQVYAIDISKRRIENLKANLARTNLKAQIIVGDIFEYKTEEKFDIVVLDAPCSATGTMRRNFDLRFLNPLDRVEKLKRNQKKMLIRCMDFIKDDGSILYCNCSLFPDEGEDIVKETLEVVSGWVIKPIKLKGLSLDSSWSGKKGDLRLRPDYWKEIGGMDGFYASLLSKQKRSVD